MAQALAARVSSRALDAMTRANIAQDSLIGLIAHPEYHFDANKYDGPELTASRQYVEACRARALRSASAEAAWEAFGRLAHAVQDFYSHSNYVRLWQARFPPGEQPGPEQIDGLDVSLLNHEQLRSARTYWPWEALWLLPPARPLLRALLPADSHARMNLDGPFAGPLFPYAMAAAAQRTLFEFERTLAGIRQERGVEAAAEFCDR